MLRSAICYVFLEIVAITEGVHPKSVNLALDTVLSFDNNDNSANIKLIDDIQNFLIKVRRVVDKKTARRNLNNVKSIKFTDFVTKFVNVLKSFEDNDLEDAFAILDDEIRKYHYKGCKFYELVADRDMRRYVAKTLDAIKGKPAGDIRKNLDGTLRAIEEAKFDTRQTEILDYTNSLYTKVNADEFENVLDNLQKYKNKSRRANVDLKKLLRNIIRTAVFDHYSKLNINTRRDLRVKLETFWQYINNSDKLNKNAWNVKYDRGNNEENNEETPLNNTEAVNDDIAFLNELLQPYKQGQINTIKRKKNMQQEINTNEEEGTVESTDTEDREWNSEEKSVNIEENKLTALEELTAKGREIEKESSRSNDEHSIDSTDKDVEIQFEPEEDSGNTNEKYTTQPFINIDSIELMKPNIVKINNGKSKKRAKLRNKKMYSFVTLYPERITRRLKNKLKIESTTNRNMKRMHTLWRETITPMKKRKNENKPSREALVAPVVNAQVNVEIPKGPIYYGLKIGTGKGENQDKPRTKLINSNKHNVKEILDDDEEIKNAEVNSDGKYLKSKLETVKEENELKFVLSLPKNTGLDPKSYRAEHKKSNKGTPAIIPPTTPRAFPLEDNSLEEVTDESVEKFTIEELDSNPEVKTTASKYTEEKDEGEKEGEEKEDELITSKLKNRVDATEEESIEYSTEEPNHKKLIMVTKLEGEIITLHPTRGMTEKFAKTPLTTVNRSIKAEKSAEKPHTTLEEKKNNKSDEDEHDSDDLIHVRAESTGPIFYKQPEPSEEEISTDSYEVIKSSRKNNDLDRLSNGNVSISKVEANKIVVAANGSKENIVEEQTQSHQITDVKPTHDVQDYSRANLTDESKILNRLGSTIPIPNTATSDSVSTLTTDVTNTNNTKETTEMITTKNITEEMDEINENNTIANAKINNTTTTLNNTNHIDVVSFKNNLKEVKTKPEISIEKSHQAVYRANGQKLHPENETAPINTTPDYNFYSNEIANADTETKKILQEKNSGWLPSKSADGINAASSFPFNVSNFNSNALSVNISDFVNLNQVINGDSQGQKRDEMVQGKMENDKAMFGRQVNDLETQTDLVPQRKSLQFPDAIAEGENYNGFDMY